MRILDRPPTVVDDTRGQAIAIGKALLSIAAFGIFYGLFAQAWNPLHAAGSEHITNETAQRGLNYTNQIHSNLLFAFLMVSVFGVIALAVYQKRGVR